MDFNEFYWHDSVLKNIYIDRVNPGKRDIIVLEIEWYDDTENKLIFEGVYWAKLNMNFGIIATECIDLAFTTEKDDSDLVALYKKWNSLIDDIELNCYVIKTISTASEIKIIAKGFKLTEK